MNSKPLKDTSRRDRLYKIADRTWNVAGWIWSAVIVVFLVSFAAGLAAASEPKNNFNVIVLNWLTTHQGDLKQEAFRIAAISVMLLFIAITLLSILFRQLFKSASSTELEELLKKDERERAAAQKALDDEGFIHYLRSVKEINQNISPKGLAQHSRTLLFTDVPLDDVFVHLQVIPDHPIFDLPYEQERQLRQIQRHTDLSDNKREDYMRLLRFTWYSQLRQDGAQARQQIPVVKVLERVFAGSPVAIILGAPGSGKTTFLRWVAYRLADNLLSSDPFALSSGASSVQIPILIQTNDYADWLAKEPGTLRQFLIIQLSETHPNASAKVLDALEHGRCLVLFDGLDEGFSPSVRRHVINSIHAFIIDHSVEDPQTQQMNNFIVTSRIADYAPEVFARYGHYTLLDLDEQLIERFLTNWCSALGRYLVPSVQGPQYPAGSGIVEVGRKQQEHLYAILKTHPGLKDLAVSPLALTLMAFMQMNGRDVLQHRFDLYQVVTRTLLDTWNRESGRKMFSEEELSLVEDVLGRFADRLQNDDGLLSTYDIEIITRQAIADFYQLQVHEIKAHKIGQLVETLRRSSGLFAEVGDGLYCFANRTFQVYFAALYLIHRTQEERRELAVKRYLSVRWSEPLLLMLMFKNARNSRDEQREINEILRAILDTPESSAIVQRNLLFIMSSIVDGRLLVTSKELRARIRSSAEHVAQQQAAHITAEQRDLIATFLHEIDGQTLDDEIPTQPLKRT